MTTIISLKNLVLYYRRTLVTKVLLNQYCGALQLMKCSFACLGYTENLPARLGGKKVFIGLSSCSGVAEKIKNFRVKCGAQRTELLDKHVYAIIVDKRQPREKKKSFKFFISFKGCLYDKENNGEDDFWFIVS